MVSIEEMKAHKANAERMKDEEMIALKRDIMKLEDAIVRMSDDIDEMISYGQVAVDCDLIPTKGEHLVRDLGRSKYDLERHAFTTEPQECCVYTDGINHKVGFVAHTERNGNGADPQTIIDGVGIENGGANGRYNLTVTNDSRYRILWETGSGKNDPTRSENKTFRRDLRKFLKDYEAWKARVLALVEANVGNNKSTT